MTVQRTSTDSGLVRRNAKPEPYKWNDCKIVSSEVNETKAKGHRTSGQSTHLGDNSKWLRNGRAVPCNSKSHFSIFDNKMINAVIYWIFFFPEAILKYMNKYQLVYLQCKMSNRQKVRFDLRMSTFWILLQSITIAQTINHVFFTIIQTKPNQQ